MRKNPKPTEEQLQNATEVYNGKCAICLETLVKLRVHHLNETDVIPICGSAFREGTCHHLVHQPGITEEDVRFALELNELSDLLNNP